MSDLHVKIGLRPYKDHQHNNNKSKI